MEVVEGQWAWQAPLDGCFFNSLLAWSLPFFISKPTTYVTDTL
jgi:hypothetical protein